MNIEDINFKYINDPYMQTKIEKLSWLINEDQKQYQDDLDLRYKAHILQKEKSYEIISHLDFLLIQ